MEFLFTKFFFTRKICHVDSATCDAELATSKKRGFKTMVRDTRYMLVHEWLRCFNLHDTDRLLELYVEKPTHFSPDIKRRHPKTHGTIYGRIPLSWWWRSIFGDDQDLRYEMDQYIPCESDTAILVYFEGVGGGRPPAHRMITFTFEGGLIQSTKIEEVDDRQSQVRGVITPRIS